MASASRRVCSICIHPARPELEKRIIAGESSIAVAADTGCSRRQLLNHFARGHVAAAAKLAKQNATLARSAEIDARGIESTSALSDSVGDLLKQANEILRNTTGIYDDAIANGQHGLALSAAQKQMNAVARVKELVEVAAKLSGEYDQKSLNLYVLPEWQEIMVFIVNTLTPYPEAKAALMEGLRARVRRSNASFPAIEDMSAEPSAPRQVEAEIV